MTISIRTSAVKNENGLNFYECGLSIFKTSIVQLNQAKVTQINPVVQLDGNTAKELWAMQTTGINQLRYWNLQKLISMDNNISVHLPISSFHCSKTFSSSPFLAINGVAYPH